MTRVKKSRSTSPRYSHNKRVVSVDPGLRKESPGALVSQQGGKLLDVLDMPTFLAPNSKIPLVDGTAVRRWLVEQEPDEIVVELVGSRPGQGVSSTFKFGAAYGGIVSVCLSVEVPVTLLSPTVWKRRAGLIGTEKAAALSLVLELFPDSAHLFRYKKHIGRADAALIGRYA